MSNPAQQRLISHRATALAAALAAIALSTVPAKAYPIDCAILLCLAGGFPASSECMAAKAEMIRRVTPWPIEPPLQLWRCPMGSPFSGPSGSGPQILPPEVVAVRDGIEIYHIIYGQRRHDGTTEVSDRSRLGRYDGSGAFTWVQTRMREAPDWVFSASGMPRNAVLVELGSVRLWRGLLLRWRDHQGNFSEEWIRY
ncbi:hypothetical protein [Paracoccus litorisediminis]|uniref:DUF2147 domain-containing protein n=1 Tax=Paracoccus litorisediminis TaxID=2006130 RepID=A0A844HTR4_9RHOB|nr:hypothetical protein [Paracoccus litorisediminis]MTH62478.1 hypothetical protein [Paracoccus litorisediminis]